MKFNHFCHIIQGSKIFKIEVRDGDTGKPRRIELSIVGDTLGFFSIEDEKYDETSGRMTAWLTKSRETTLDRENPVSTIYRWPVDL